MKIKTFSRKHNGNFNSMMYSSLFVKKIEVRDTGLENNAKSLGIRDIYNSLKKTIKDQLYLFA